MIDQKKKQMRSQKSLPMYGVGPVYVAIILILTIMGILFAKLGVIHSGHISGLQIPAILIGILLIIYGIYIYCLAAFQSRLEDHVKQHTLITTGIYSLVRNPCYSCFLLICTGAIVISDNLWLLILPPVYWLFLTVLMKCTEEKWLLDAFGEEYVDYCRKVNRCIPWGRIRK